MADTLASGASERKLVGVQIPPRPPTTQESSARPEAGGVNHRRLALLLAALLVAVGACGGRAGTALGTPDLPERPRPLGIGIGERRNSSIKSPDGATSTRGT